MRAATTVLLRSAGAMCYLASALFALATAPAIAGQVAAAASSQLSGVWNLTGGGGSGAERSAFEQHSQSQWSAAALPFTPQGQARFQANKPGKGPRQVKPALGNDPIGGANPPGLYRSLVYSRPFELVQLPGKVIQLFELGRIWRTIHTDGRPVPDDVAAGPYWYGYSVGSWERDTLVVTTLGLDGRAWLDEWGTPFSDSARIEERWRRIAPDRLQLTLTVNDAENYSKAWSSTPLIYRLQTGIEPEEIIFAPMDENAFNESIRDPAGLPAR